jgi:hypothetical protein
MIIRQTLSLRCSFKENRFSTTTYLSENSFRVAGDANADLSRVRPNSQSRLGKPSTVPSFQGPMSEFPHPAPSHVHVPPYFSGRFSRNKGERDEYPGRSTREVFPCKTSQVCGFS